jgi:cytoskeletal protein CcmA (bactofilin family)
MRYTVQMTEENRNTPAAAAERRFLDGVRASPTVVGAGTVIIGDVRGPGPFFISGEIHGDGDVLGDLHVAVGGSWNGHVRARRAIVAGRMSGSLRVEDKLEIGYTAVIHGNVSAASIAIAKGAVIDGEIEVTSGDSVQRFDEKRGE